jgi:hypothetical protein
MTKREKKAFVVVTAPLMLAAVAIAVGGRLLGASSEVVSTAWVVLVAVGAVVSAFAFDRLSAPPDSH